MAKENTVGTRGALAKPRFVANDNLLAGTYGQRRSGYVGECDMLLLHCGTTDVFGWTNGLGF